MTERPSVALSFAAQFQNALAKISPESPPLTSDASKPLEALALACPLYAKHLLKHPEDRAWLHGPTEASGPLHISDYKHLWQNYIKKPEASLEAKFSALRQFRRLQSMRVAYHEVNKRYSTEASMQDHSTLAEFCIQEVTRYLHQHFEAKLGTPWLHARQAPCNYTILALGKLGGQELNFCSDVDLIFIYENDGECHKEGKTTLSNREFYERFFQELRSVLHTKTQDGFLFNVDMRLRPEGKNSSIAKSLPFTENYYWSRGQTWERMALIKARPIAGNKELGEELLETLNPFRYPQFLSTSILDEVAILKQRVEHEVLKGEDPTHNIKSGKGGIREIEYIAQTLQLLHAGKNPFIQCTQTHETLSRLHRYHLLTQEDTQMLQSAYSFLRSVENRLQMGHETPTHSLPKSPKEQAHLAQSLNFKDYSALEETLNTIRNSVHQCYKKFFSSKPYNAMQEAWQRALSSDILTSPLKEKLATWFSDERGFQAIKKLIMGTLSNQVTQEQIRLCTELSAQFDDIFSKLASPTLTIERFARLAEKYGARIAWIKTCITRPLFFQTLCLLLDRSEFIAELLTKHPEILEELLMVNITERKTKDTLIHEIQKLPQGDAFPQYLWLYVKAEQVRAAICSITHEWGFTTIQNHLSTLADATLNTVLKQIDPEESLAVIALGKYGSCELTYGSDLDLIFLSTHEYVDPDKILSIQKCLHYKSYTHPIFSVDLRLRPYGIDGPMACTLQQFKNYYIDHAKPWEKQMLTRSRIIGGNAHLKSNFEAFKELFLFSNAPSKDFIEEVRNMHTTIQKNKATQNPPELAFKAHRGGLVHCEFAAQTIQLFCGPMHSALRSCSTLKTFKTSLRLHLFPEATLTHLIEGYLFLTKLEHFLRRDKNVAITQISSNTSEQERLAQWLGFTSFKAFWTHYLQVLTHNESSIEAIFEQLRSM
ncbi:MAG: bifunctional [glutamate--ammonia ligase]-adenylyl-L-tyrosine phosphorylase/[glutamate--ammonia-ligase] adenylyltransferase [Opitutales bacterium]